MDVAGGANVAGGLVANSAKVSDLTEDRIVFAGVAGELEDSNKLMWDGSELYVDGDAEITGGLSAGSLIINQPEDQVLFMAADGSIESKDAFMFIDGGTAANDKIDLNGELDVLNKGIFRGDVEVVGDLKVLGNSVEFKVGEQLIEDMIIKLGHGLSGNSFSTHDAGFVFEYDGETDNNMAIFWDSDATEFKLADVGGYTGGSALFPAVEQYSDLRIKDLKAVNADLSGTLSVTGAASFATTLDVDGAADFQEAVTMHKTISVGQTASLLGALSVAGDSDLQDVDINATLDVIGQSTFGALVDINADTNLAGRLTLDGSLREITAGTSSMDIIAGELHLDASGALKLHGVDIDFDCHGATYAFNGCTSQATADAIKVDWNSYVGQDQSIIEAIIENAKGGKDMSMDIELQSNVDGSDAVPGIITLPEFNEVIDNATKIGTVTGHKIWKHADEDFARLADTDLNDLFVYVNGALMIRGKDYAYDAVTVGDEKKLAFYFDLDSDDTISVHFPKIRS
jgi:hypothetical protein